MRPIDADALLKGKDDHEMISTHLIFNAPTLDVIKAEVLDEIRAEIMEDIDNVQKDLIEEIDQGIDIGLQMALDTINKYIIESEDKE